MRTLGWVIALILAPTLALGDERPIRVELDYRAPAECPGRDAFVARIRQTNARVTAADQTAPLGVKVRVALLANKDYEAKLFIRSSDSEDTTRSLTAASCDELMVAAAVVVAVLADTADAALAKAQAKPTLATPTPAPSAPSEPPKVHESPSEPWHIGLGIDLAADAGLGPDLELQARPFIAVSHSRLALRLALQRNTVSVSTGDGTAETEWWLARSEGCYRVTSAESIALYPCLGFEAGSVSASGSSTRRPRDEARLVLGPLALVRLGIRLTDGLAFQLDAGVRIPLSRYRFVFGEDTTAYEMPSVALTSGIGIGFVSP
jgi:hypothetical protein